MRILNKGERADWRYGGDTEIITDAEIEALKQKQDKDELMDAHRAPADIDIQVNTKEVQRAAADVKKEIDKALKSIF